MKLAVVIPVYNTGEYVEKSIKSIFQQTVSDSIITVLVDDGSTDNSGKICDDYANKYDNVCALHKKNGGAASARNYGLDYLFENNIEFDYIAFLDSDDFIHPEMYESLIRLIEENNADIASCKYRFVDPDEELSFAKIDCKIDDVIMCKDEMGVLIKYVGAVSIISSCMRVCKKHIFEDLRYKEGYIDEDSMILPYIWEKTNKWVRTNEVLYFWTERKGSVTRSEFCEKDFARIMVSYVRAEFFEERKIIKELGRYSKEFMNECVRFSSLAKEHGLEECFLKYRKLYNKKWFKYMICGKYCFNEYLMHILFRLHIPYGETIYKKLNPDWNTKK